MKFGYARVSTVDQNLDSQVDELKAAGCDKIFTEKVTGNGSKVRPELDRLLDQVREGDAIVVYKLDRLGRSCGKLIALAEELEGRGIELISLQEQIDTTAPYGKLVFRILTALAEMERDIIVERTKAGLQAARRRGRKGGRPRVPRKDTDRALKLYELGEHSVKEIEEMTGVKPHTLYRRLKERKEA
jgi:DNA invertase Pin-like site-specific DNA recombinase